MTTVRKLKGLLRKKALTQGAVVLLDQGALSIATFVAGVLLARTVTKEGYSLYVLGWTVLVLFQGVHRALVNLPYSVYAPRYSTEELHYYNGSTLVHTFVLCTIFAATLASSDYILVTEKYEISGQLSEIILPLIFLTVPLLLREYGRNILLAALNVFASVKASLLASTTFLLAVCTLYYYGKLNTAAVFIIFGLSSLLAALFIFWQQRHTFRVRSRNIFSHFRKNWNIGKWILINAIAFMGASQAYPWLLVFLIDQNAVAAYGACFAVASVLAPLLRGSSAYILPRMSHGAWNSDVSELVRLLRLSIAVLFVPYIAWLIIGILFKDTMVPLFYSDAYSGYGVLFVLLLIRVTIENVFAPLTSALQVAERPSVTTVSVVISALVTLVIGPLLIMRFGLNGAGITAIMSTSLGVLWKGYGVYRIIHKGDKSTKNGKMLMKVNDKL